MNKIKEMMEDGFAVKRIAKILNLNEKGLKEEIIKNNYCLLKEKFDESSIERILNLYSQGVSAKQLGKKFSIDKRRVQKWAQEKNFLRSKKEANRITPINENVLDVIDNPEKAYWLGFFYADAYNCNQTCTVSVTLKDEDYVHLVKLSKLFNIPENKIQKYLSKIDNKEYPTCSLRIYSKHLCDKLTELGCPQKKSFIIKFPLWLNKNLYSHFLRGLFDGDGCLTYRSKQKEWKWSIASTKEMCEEIQKIFLNNFNFITNYYCISETNNNTYSIDQSGNKRIATILHWLYKDSTVNTRLDRKYQKYIDFIKERNIPMINTDKNQISMFDEVKKEPTQLSLFNDVALNPVKTVEVQKIADKKPVKPRSKKSSTKSTRSISEFERIVEINGQPITTTYVKSLDLEERLALVEPLFQHFRKTGWLYPDNESDLKKSYQKLLDLKVDLTTNELFNNSSLATDICKFFCHKFYEATEHKQPTMKEVFNDDDKLRYLIKNRLGLDWWDNPNNDETFNICFRMLIQGMRSSRLVPSISIFKPDIAKYMYMKYSAPGETVFDYSAGWGGRMLGAAAAGVKYIGVDPWTTDELENIVKYFSLQDITLIKNGSENVRLEENSIDFCFSSPPYYDQEVYSKEDTQAYNKGEDHFYNVYWKNTLENIKYMLKPGKYFGLNIKNFPKMLEMAKEVFGEVVEEVKLRTVRSHLNKSAGVEKYEPIYIFKNSK